MFDFGEYAPYIWPAFGATALAFAWMIGDSPTDVEAAQRAKLRSALVFAQNRCELCPLRNGSPIVPEVTAPRFDEVARRIVRSGALLS